MGPHSCHYEGGMILRGIEAYAVIGFCFSVLASLVDRCTLERLSLREQLEMFVVGWIAWPWLIVGLIRRAA